MIAKQFVQHVLMCLFSIPQSPEIDYIKMNVQSVKSRQRSTVQTAKNPLKAPPTHQRGAIPK